MEKKVLVIGVFIYVLFLVIALYWMDVWGYKASYERCVKQMDTFITNDINLRNK